MVRRHPIILRLGGGDVLPVIRELVLLETLSKSLRTKSGKAKKKKLFELFFVFITLGSFKGLLS